VSLPSLSPLLLCRNRHAADNTEFWEDNVIF